MDLRFPVDQPLTVFPSSSTNTPTGKDVMVGSNTWSDGTDEAAGSVAGIGSCMMSMVGISWVSQSVVGSGFLSAVGIASGSGVLIDVKWGWTLGMESSSTLPTVIEDPSTHRTKLIYSTRVQQESFLSITI